MLDPRRVGKLSTKGIGLHRPDNARDHQKLAARMSTPVLQLQRDDAVTDRVPRQIGRAVQLQLA